MNSYIETKVCVTTIDSAGKERKLPITCLCQSETFADAELKALEASTGYDCVTIQKMQSVKYSEIIKGSTSDSDSNTTDLLYYKFRVAFITFDERTGKEKRTVVPILVEGEDDKDARLNFENSMQTSVTDWQIISISESPIREIL